MQGIVFTERQRREQEYYDKYAKTMSVDKEVDFSPVDGPMNGTESRPWNSYWAVYEMAVDHFEPGHTLLDFGSGPGTNALRFAKIGYQVEGFDISQENINVSEKLFKKYKLQDKGHFQVASAEALPYEDNAFNSIVGIDILHHVDIPKAIEECKRVLKPGGLGIFREPIEVPLFERIRNTTLVKKFAPKEKSFELHITEDERKLNQTDVEIIRASFPKTELRRFLLFSRLNRFLPTGKGKPSNLEKFDQFLIDKLPSTGNLGGDVVFILQT